MTTNRAATWGAIALNLPTVVAAAYLPAAALIVMTVALAVIGALLGALAAWGHAYDGAPHEVIELAPARDERRAA